MSGQRAAKRPFYRLRRTLAGVSLEAKLAARRLGAARRRPSVFIIGVQKAGTTTLFGELAKHPQVLPPLVKEVHYFDVAAERGDGWYGAHFPTEAEARAVEDRTGAPVLTFDDTPYYIFQPEVTARLLSYAPDARVIAVLRDPVARAWSHYWHEHARGFEPLPPLEAFAAEAERVPDPHVRVGDTAAARFAHQHYSYCARGEYDLQLARWKAAMPAERLLCLRSEALFADPAATLARVADFLGLPPFPDAPGRALNTGRYEQPPAEVMEVLRGRLAGSMARTAAMLGPEFAWE